MSFFLVELFTLLGQGFIFLVQRLLLVDQVLALLFVLGNRGRFGLGLFLRFGFCNRFRALGLIVGLDF